MNRSEFVNSSDLKQRIKSFALRMIPLCEVLPEKRIGKIVEDQLLRASFSAAANYHAACNAQSKKAFIAKLSIALEEMDETHFWLEIVADLKLIEPNKLTLLLKEAGELTKILGTARRTAFKQLTINN